MAARPSCFAFVCIPGGAPAPSGSGARPVGGMPLFAHVLGAARRSSSVDRALVCTDDPAVASLARAHGAVALDVPAALLADPSAPEPALLHALAHLQATEGGRPELVVAMAPAAPLTAPEDVDATVRALLAEGAERAVTVTAVRARLWKRGPDGRAVPLDDDAGEPRYRETGAVVAMRTDALLAAGRRPGGRPALHEVPPERAGSVDTPEDRLLVEARLAARGARDLLARLPPRLGALVMDFDGVLTDDKVTVREDGVEAVVCSRSDGFGIEQLVKRGFPVAVISKEKNPVVEARCRKLRVECHQGIEDKAPLFRAWLEKKGIAPADAIYVGNDVTDVACMELAGLGVTVADAHPRAFAAADFVLSRRGGQGAIRELADRIVEKLDAERRGGA